ncbi:MAG: adenylyltransferase/cytidyltransferase family protein [Patescibacteria group bacterium]
MHNLQCKVFVFGVFDLFHPGHVAFLREARQHGEHLIVNLTQDSVVEELKGMPPVHSWDERHAILMQSGLVDEIVAGDKMRGMFSQVVATRPDVIAFGYDQGALQVAVEAWIKRYAFNIRTVRLAPYKQDQYKSSILRATYDRSKNTSGT